MTKSSIIVLQFANQFSHFLNYDYEVPKNGTLIDVHRTYYSLKYHWFGKKQCKSFHV